MLKLYFIAFSIILFLSGSCGDIKYSDLTQNVQMASQNNVLDNKIEKFSCEDMLEKLQNQQLWSLTNNVDTWR